MMKLPLRDLIADWGIAALADPAAEPPLRALAAFAAACDTTGTAVGLHREQAEQLIRVEQVFERYGDTVRLGETLLPDRNELRRRVSRFIEAVECRSCGPAPFVWNEYASLPGRDSAEPSVQELDWSFCAAGVLFNLGLYFETHEILEPCWLRAKGALKSFLQGLIQVSVGLHHYGNGNLRGAYALLNEGNDKLLSVRPQAWGVELNDFCIAVAGCARQVTRQKSSALAPLANLPRFIFRPKSAGLV